MEKDENYLFASPLLKGEVVLNPTYQEQELEDYQRNPFIEALPPLFTMQDVIDKFTVYPLINENDRYKEAYIRYHMIKRIKHFIQPLEVHFAIERKLSTMLRMGYLARNPFSKDFIIRLQMLNEVKEEKAENREERLEEMGYKLRSTADSLSIIGISGIGKTTAMEKLLLMYPQVIHHHEYKGHALTRTQIVWIKIDCPYDGSIKTLCKLFFKAVDDVLGTTRYFQKFGNNRNSAATMMIHMTYLASVYSIGLLVIDEIQHLINTKNSPDEMLNFFVTLVNTIGIPTVLVGTFKALKVLKKDFRQARRAGSEGVIIWDRMERSEDTEDSEWDFFIETLWEFQYLKTPIPLSQELKNVMYEESQGITAIAVNLFIIAQERALNTNDEKLTVGLIKKTAQKDLSVIQPMIQALRNNRIQDIAKYEDIAINLDDILGSVKEQIEIRGKIKEYAAQVQKIRSQQKNDVAANLAIDLSVMGIFDKLTEKELNEVIREVLNTFGTDVEYTQVKKEVVKLALAKNLLKEEESKRKSVSKTRPHILAVEDLRSIYEKAKKDKVHIYDLLKEKGVIKNPTEEFLKVK